MNAPDHFRVNLRTAAQGRGLSQRAIAEKAGLTFAYVNRVLMGTACPTLATADAMADAVGCKLSHLILPPKEFSRVFSAAA